MPERPRTVVVDTTPIIALSSIGQLDVLPALYKEIVIPPAVEAEVLARSSRAGGAELKRADWIRVQELKDPFKALLLSDLGEGEAETLVLAEELKAQLVVIDERRARSYAKYLGFPPGGRIGRSSPAGGGGMIRRSARPKSVTRTVPRQVRSRSFGSGRRTRRTTSPSSAGVIPPGSSSAGSSCAILDPPQTIAGSSGIPLATWSNKFPPVP